MLFVSSIVALYLFIFDATLFNIVLFYGAPAILSSGQLFYFGTYLPHLQLETDMTVNKPQKPMTKEQEFAAKLEVAKKAGAF